MGSKFAIVSPYYKGEEEDLTENDYTIIGTSHYLYDNVKPLVMNLPLDTPIISIDNDTDFKTLGEYLKSLIN